MAAAHEHVRAVEPGHPRQDLFRCGPERSGLTGVEHHVDVEALCDLQRETVAERGSTLGYGFALQLAQSFNVDMVLDTGDTGSFGTTADQAILTWVPGFDRPYVFVRGSHDSLAFQQAVAAYPNAIVLDGNATDVAGLTIYGLGDPYFVSARGAPKTDDQITRLVESVAPGLRDDVRALPRPPDIVAVHDERMAELAAGYAPVVASGHFHVNQDRAEDGTLFLQVGTTGGAGPTGFTPEGDVPSRPRSSTSARAPTARTG